MNKLRVAVFGTETAAFWRVSALRELHAAGISHYEAAVLVKDGTSKISVKQVDEKAPAGDAVGFLSGGLIGLLGEPVGVPVAVRGLTGLLCDLFRSAPSVTFVDDVSKALASGKAAIIADMTSRIN